MDLGQSHGMLTMLAHSYRRLMCPDFPSCEMRGCQALNTQRLLPKSTVGLLFRLNFAEIHLNFLQGRGCAAALTLTQGWYLCDSTLNPF